MSDVSTPTDLLPLAPGLTRRTRFEQPSSMPPAALSEWAGKCSACFVSRSSEYLCLWGGRPRRWDLRTRPSTGMSPPSHESCSTRKTWCALCMKWMDAAPRQRCLRWSAGAPRRLRRNFSRHWGLPRLDGVLRGTFHDLVMILWLLLFVAKDVGRKAREILGQWLLRGNRSQRRAPFV